MSDEHKKYEIEPNEFDTHAVLCYQRLINKRPTGKGISMNSFLSIIYSINTNFHDVFFGTQILFSGFLFAQEFWMSIQVLWLFLEKNPFYVYFFCLHFRNTLK